MDLDEATTKKIQELQILEQNLQGLIMQKQTIQIELNEISNALKDLKKSDDEVYRITGGIMLKANKADLTRELEEKKKILDLRVSAIEKQEKILEEKSEKSRKEISDTLEKRKTS